MMVLAFCGVRVWIWIQLVLLSCKPESAIGVKDFFAQRRQEFLEHPSAIDSNSICNPGSVSNTLKSR